MTSANLEAYAKRLARYRLRALIEACTLQARRARARASLVINPLSGRHYGSDTLGANHDGAPRPAEPGEQS